MDEKDILLKTHEKTFILELEAFLDQLHASATESRDHASDVMERIARLKAWITKQEIKKSELRGA